MGIRTQCQSVVRANRTNVGLKQSSVPARALPFKSANRTNVGLKPGCAAEVDCIGLGANRTNVGLKRRPGTGTVETK